MGTNCSYYFKARQFEAVMFAKLKSEMQHCYSSINPSFPSVEGLLPIPNT